MQAAIDRVIHSFTSSRSVSLGRPEPDEPRVVTPDEPERFAKRLLDNYRAALARGNLRRD